MRRLPIIPTLISSLALAACSTTHEFRVAAVGDTEAAAASGAAGPGAGAPLIVASGNVLLGPAGQLVTASGTGATSGIANGTVSGVLPTTTQTVVQLADGASILVNGVGGTLGDAVSLNVAQGQVIGGPVALLGNSLPGVSTGTGTVLGGTPVAGATGGAGSSGGGSGALPANPGQVLAPMPATTSVLQPVTAPITNSVGGTVSLPCC